MAHWRRLGLISLMVTGLWLCAPGGSLKCQEQPPRFTKADNGVITDHATGLDWYVGPNRDNTWPQAKAWVASLTVAGGGWRLPSMAELKALYLKDASPNNMDPVFQTKGVWVWSGELNNAWSVWGFAFYSGLEGWHSMNYGYGRQALAVRPHR